MTDLLARQGVPAWVTSASSALSSMYAASTGQRFPLVLVVDDHPDSRIIARIVLESAGFRVADAQTGTEGLRAAIDLHPSVVLLDMVLPGLDGWEIARRLRSNESTSRCVIIAVTALVGLRDHDRARLAGCDDVLIKPVSPVAIVKAISDRIELPSLAGREISRMGRR